MQNNKYFLLDFVFVVAVVVIALFVIKELNISYPLTVVNTSKSTELAVVGEGKIEVLPDTAYVSVGITIDNRASVKEVQDTINTINNKIIASLDKLDINKSDIKTANYSVYPNYKYENNISSISGYNGNATVQIKLKDTSLVPETISTVTEAGANQIQGVNFSVDKPELYREQAREKAIKNAREQAEKIAKDLGIRLGRITNIVESSGNQSSLLNNKSFPLSGGGGGAPNPEIEGGSQNITSAVTLYFEKK